jgi:hypothetical protein
MAFVPEETAIVPAGKPARAILYKPYPKKKPIRSMKRINVFGNRGYLKLLRASRFKKPYTLMGMVRWDTELDHFAGMSDAQWDTINAFGLAANATKEMALSDRMAIIGAALRGRVHPKTREPRKPVYPTVSTEERVKKAGEIRSMLAARFRY